MQLFTFKIMRMTLVLLGALVLSACSTTGEKKLSDSERARLHLEAAASSMMEGDITETFVQLDRAEKLQKNLPETHHLRGLAFVARENFQEAIAEVQKAIQLKSDYSDANNTLGKLYLDLGRTKEAREPLEKAASDLLYRDAYKPLTNLGILHYRLENHQLARSYFDRAIKTSPDFACVAHYYRGNLNLKDERFREAVKDYNQATQRVCASFVEAHFALGIAYSRNREYDRARKKFLEVRDRFPSSQYSQKAMEQLRYLP